MRLGCGEPSHLTGNSGSITWSCSRTERVGGEVLPIVPSAMLKTTRMSYLGKKSDVLGSYGKRKSSSSRRGDSKALHLSSSLLKWKCWGMSWQGSNKMKVAPRWSSNRERKWQGYKLSSVKNRKLKLLLVTSSWERFDGILGVC